METIKELNIRNKKTQNLLFDVIQKDITERKMSAGWSGLPHDNGASGLESELRVYQAGLAGEIPKTWKKYENEVIDTLIDPEYETYLRLKDKFENKE